MTELEIVKGLLRDEPLRDMRAAIAAQPLAQWGDPRVAAVAALALSLRELAVRPTCDRILNAAHMIVAEPRDNAAERIDVLRQIDAALLRALGALG